MLGSITKENFNQLLGKFTTYELENLLQKYPYFHQAHILLAKKYQQENNPKFDEQLQLAVLYSQDREFLFSVFQEVNTRASFNIQLPVFKPKPIELVKPTVIEESLNNSVEIEEIQTITSVVEEVTVPVIQPEEETLVEQKPQEEFVIEVPVSIEIQEETPLAEPELKHEEITVQQGEPASLPFVEETFVTTEPHTFDEWLTAFAQPETVKLELHQESLPEEPEKQDAELEQLIMSNSRLHELVEEEAHYSKGLDVFIEEQKQKHKPQESLKPKDENEMAPELITETMAKIYEMQKKYSKAIQAYEILTLKYPKKNDFFAARINYLKNII